MASSRKGVVHQADGTIRARPTLASPAVRSVRSPFLAEPLAQSKSSVSSA